MSERETPIAARPDHASLSRLAYATIAIAFGLGGAWAGVARLDSAAIAAGRIEAETKTKAIQHLEGGIVSEILVKEGDAVQRDQILFRIEPVQYEADKTLLAKRLVSAQARQDRLMAERGGASQIVWSGFERDVVTAADVQAVRARERSLFEERREAQQREIEISQSRISQARREIEGRMQQRDSYEAQVASVEGELKRLKPLVAKRLVTSSRIQSLERDAARYRGEVGKARADIARAKERIAETELRIHQVEKRFQEQVAKELVDTGSTISDVEQRLRVAEDALKRVNVRAAQDGVVQGIAVHAPGAVVPPGATLAELVPVRDALFVTARVSPNDIDSVVPGQMATVRFPSLSSRRLPEMKAALLTVSADIVAAPEEETAHYVARLRVDSEGIPKDVRELLIPGMPAEVLVSTGQRTALAYLLSPLTDVVASSMREE